MESGFRESLKFYYDEDSYAVAQLSAVYYVSWELGLGERIKQFQKIRKKKKKHKNRENIL